MPLTVDPADLARISIVPWDREESQFGLSWDLKDGRSGVDYIGSRELAEGEMSRVKRARLRSMPYRYWAGR
jgi:hypothetical protein